MTQEIRLKDKYRVGGHAKKAKIPAGGNSGTGQVRERLPVGIPRHYKGKTHYR